MFGLKMLHSSCFYVHVRVMINYIFDITVQLYIDTNVKHIHSDGNLLLKQKQLLVFIIHSKLIFIQ